jgi:amino acid transporter
MLRRLLGLDAEGSGSALCPSCGAATESDPCPECGSPLRPPPSPAALGLVGALWLVAILGAAAGANILGGNSPVLNRASGALFFLPLLLALAVSLLWVLRLRRRAKSEEKAEQG